MQKPKTKEDVLNLIGLNAVVTVEHTDKDRGNFGVPVGEIGIIIPDIYTNREGVVLSFENKNLEITSNLFPDCFFSYDQIELTEESAEELESTQFFQSQFNKLK